MKGVVKLTKEGDSIFKFQHAEKVVNNNTGSSAIYVIGILGSLIYFIQRADGFWEIILGIVKAIFWPALIVYQALELLKL